MAVRRQTVYDAYAGALPPQLVCTAGCARRSRPHVGVNDAGADDADHNGDSSSHWMDRASVLEAHVDAEDDWLDNPRTEVADVATAAAEGQRKSFPRSAPRANRVACFQPD